MSKKFVTIVASIVAGAALFWIFARILIFITQRL